jgi:hypothetical protein
MRVDWSYSNVQIRWLRIFSVCLDFQVGCSVQLSWASFAMASGPSISKSLPNQLGIHLFLAKQEKLCSNSLASNLANFSNSANLPPPRAYLRAEREHASLAHPASRAYLSGALRFLAGLFVRLAGLFLFYQVQMANSWRESIFSLAIYFSKLSNQDICQVNFGKLLDMMWSNIRTVHVPLAHIDMLLCFHGN